MPVRELVSQDIKPPRLITPRHLAVIQTNAVHFAAQPSLPDSQVRAVSFYASYTDYNRQNRITELAASDSAAPYEAVWQCAHLPDQAIFDLRFFCVQHSTISPDSIRSIVIYTLLDRNNQLSDLTLEVPFAARKVRIDGKTEPKEHWGDSTQVQIINGESRYTVQACWDRDNLYFFYRACDATPFTPDCDTAFLMNPGSWDSLSLNNVGKFKPVWKNDMITIEIDCNHNHAMISDSSDILITAARGGVVFCYAQHASRGRFVNRLREIVAAVGPFHDSANPNLEGYQLECAIPWTLIGRKPSAGLSLGLDFGASDRKSAEPPCIISSWSRSPHIGHNSSEWGNLVLLKKERTFSPYWAAVMVLVMLSGVLLFYYARKGRRALRPQLSKPQQVPESTEVCERSAASDPAGHLIERAREYIDNNLSEPNLDRQSVATHLNVSPDYLSRHFKSCTRMSFSRYVNLMRVEKAAHLLRTTQMNITAISLECGYTSLDHFSRTFKQINRLSPKMFRAKMSGTSQ